MLKIQIIYQKIQKNKNNSIGIKVYNLSNRTVYGEFESISAASKSLNCSPSAIRYALKTQKKQETLNN